jgi:hypothetical protein
LTWSDITGFAFRVASMDIVYEYEKQYRQLEFERIGLFCCIKKAFEVDSVVYIGSSIHIAPSFVFRHVTYIESGPTADEFCSH